MAKSVLEFPQRTLRRPAAFDGVGLHTGHAVRLVCYPAGEGSGILFLRTDSRPPVAIPARSRFVTQTNRGTVIGIDDKPIHTVEHLLSACTGLGITNLLVEITGDECPALDGSAEVFIKRLLNAGVVKQIHPVAALPLDQTVTIQDGDKSMTAEPADHLEISYTLNYPDSFVGKQEASFNAAVQDYREEIAPARTYGFKHEVDALLKSGLARGGSLDNAIVIGDKEYSSPLRFPNELARHKILDLMGDIALLGRPLCAKIRAFGTGHTHNVALVEKILKTVK